MIQSEKSSLILTGHCLKVLFFHDGLFSTQSWSNCVCDLPEETKELGIPAFRLVVEVLDAVKENVVVKCGG